MQVEYVFRDRCYLYYSDRSDNFVKDVRDAAIFHTTQDILEFISDKIAPDTDGDDVWEVLQLVDGMEQSRMIIAKIDGICFGVDV